MKTSLMPKCKSCRHFRFTCSWLLNRTGEEEQCDWGPSRYKKKPSYCKDCKVKLQDQPDCRKHGIQNCHICNEIICGDNPHKYHVVI